MDDMMSKLAGKSPEKDDSYEAKMKVLNELRDMAMGMMGDKVKDKLPGMKSISVSAPDKEGLEKGLDLAQSLAGDSGKQSSSAIADAMDASPEEASEESDMDDDMSADEIDMMIKELQAKKAAKLGQGY